MSSSQPIPPAPYLRYETARPRAIPRLAILGTTLVAASLLMSPETIGPSITRCLQPATNHRCASNLRQIGQAMQLYANENNNAYPPSFQTLLATKALGTELLTCPFSPASKAPTRNPILGSAPSSYVYLAANQTTHVHPDFVLVYETFTDHSNQGGHLLFANGRVEFFLRPKQTTLLAELAAGQNPPPSLHKP